MDIVFDEINYTPRSWKIRGPQRTLLKNVSGSFKGGNLSAVMGPSGSGKSTLLNVLSGVTASGVSGNLLFNGCLRERSALRKVVRYIAQEDSLQPMVTVREVMHLAVRLKLPESVTEGLRQKTVETILKRLGLLQSVDTRTERLSGGEKKRLSLALELVDNPPVFLLDEPLSGLDTVAASSCLSLLRNLARDGHTVVLTLHAPSATHLSLLDHILVLARGRCVYRGSPSSLVPFLEKVGVSCPSNHNPADILIEMTEWDETAGKTLADYMQDRNTDYDLVVNNNNNGMETTRSNTMSLKNVYQSFPASSLTQFFILLELMMLKIFRNKIGLGIQLFHHTICAAFAGIIYFNQANEAEQMRTHLNFCFYVTMFSTYTYLMAPILVFPDEVKLAKKEHFNSWYNLNSYYAAMTASRLPLQIILTTYFMGVSYWMSGLPQEWYRFAIMNLITILTCFAAEGIGLMFGSVLSVQTGSVFGPVFLAPMFGMAVYGLDFARNLPRVVFWLLRLSFMRSGAFGLIIAMFGLDRQPLNCSDMFCPFSAPSVLLHFLDIQDSSVWVEIGNLSIIIIVTRALLWYGLRYTLSP